MKIRCVNDSIRLRIRKSELQQLKETRQIQAHVNFPNGVVFSYVLCYKEVSNLQALFENHTITIILPKTQALHWMNTNEVGIEKLLPLNAHQNLHVLIEKDFPCLDRADEDKSDTFEALATQQSQTC